jgi:O-antigen/teichoic acid export membrane protein
MDVIVAKIKSLGSDSLYRNSMYLLTNMGISAVVGFLFWIVCARLYSSEDVGIATALLGALGLATTFSSLGLNRTIVRFLGNSKTQAQDIITKLALICGGSLIVGTILALCLHSFGVTHANLMVITLFIATVVMSSAKSIFDSTFVALRAASGTLLENSVANVLKLALPVFVVSWGFIGIFAAQLVAATGAVLCSILILRKKFAYKLRTKPSRDSLQGKWRFMFGSYTSDMIGGLPNNILPILVVAKLGPSQGALWYAAMLLVNFLLLVSSTINQVMFAEISNAAGSIKKLVTKSLAAMYALVIPLTAAIFVFAPNILGLFNDSYRAATPILRLMAVFALLGVINYVTGSILAFYKKVAFLTFANVVNALVVIAYCYLFATDLHGIVIGWICGEIINLVLFVGGAAYYTKQARATAGLTGAL